MYVGKSVTIISMTVFRRDLMIARYILWLISTKRRKCFGFPLFRLRFSPSSPQPVGRIVLSRARNTPRVLNAIAQISKTRSELSVIFPKARESFTGLRRLRVCLPVVLAPSAHRTIYIYVRSTALFECVCVCETSIIGVNIYNEINRARGRENFWALWQEERNLWHN